MDDGRELVSMLTALSEMGTVLAQWTAVAVTLPPMLIDLVASLLAARAPIAMIARCRTREEAEPCVAALHPDLVMVGLFPNETHLAGRQFMSLSPESTVVTLAADGAAAQVHTAGDPFAALHDVSPESLADAIVAALRARVSSAANDLDH